MPTNPLRAINDWLHGADLQAASPTAVADRLSDAEKQFSMSGVASDQWGQVQHILIHGPGSDYNSQYESDGNSAVFACLLALSSAYIEPPVKVWSEDATGKREPLPKHPMQTLLDDPHPELTDLEVWFWTQWARHCDGNAYLRKIRSGNELTGNVIYLHPLNPALIVPMTDPSGDEFISNYRWNYAPGKWEDIDPTNIIHFRMGVDNRDTRKGMSPLKRLVRMISTDEEASKFSDALLKNFGVPGLVVKTPPDSQKLTRDEAEALSERIAERFTGDGRGRVGILSAGADIAPVGFSPDQMKLDALHGFPESRICAVMGVPPIVANLQIGLEQAANYASMRQVRENFTEIKLIPTWRMDDRVLQKHLLPDFDSKPNVVVARDLGDVRALQEDEDAKYARLTEAVKVGWLTADEARAETGFPPMDEVVPPTPAPSEFPPGPSAVPPEQVAAMRRVLEMKQAGFEDYPAIMAAMIDLAFPGFASDLDAYFEEQRQRVMHSALGA